jgi:hypothetical protein
LKEATRLAHEALQDLKDERTEQERHLKAWKEELRVVMQDYVKAELIETSDAIERMKDKLWDQLSYKFDSLTEIMLGRDPKSKRKGQPSLQELVEVRNLLDRVHDTIPSALRRAQSDG